MTARPGEYSLLQDAQDHALATAARLVTLAQPQGYRAPTEAELGAEVRYDVIDQQEQDALAGLTGVLTAYMARVLERLLAGGSRPADIAMALQAMQWDQPDEDREDTGDTAVTVLGHLGQVTEDAAVEAGGEAERQGVASDRVAEATAMVAVPSILTATTLLVVGAARQRALASGAVLAQHHNTDPTREVPAKDMLDPTSVEGVAGVLDMARQGVHQAQGLGRQAALEALNPRKYLASELLDKRTCERCERVDGTEYATLADAQVDYPHGIYHDCLGGSRCRGLLVGVYR